MNEAPRHSAASGPEKIPQAASRENAPRAGSASDASAAPISETAACRRASRAEAVVDIHAAAVTAAASPAFQPTLAPRAAWWMLLALTGGFTLSQAFRTLGAIMAPPLAGALQLTAQQLALWSAAFHFAFGAMQPVMGVALDLVGVRRTILLAFPLAALGALVSATAHSYGALMLGQVLIGTGCAPAFLVCTLFIGRHFAARRFTALSGLVMSVASLGVLATATPMAWLIEASSWRAAFAALAGGAAAAWLAIWWLVREPKPPTGGIDGDGGGDPSPAPAQSGARVHPHPDTPAAPRPGVAQALRELLGLFALPHTLGLVAFAAVAYACFITLRGLWLGPLLVGRHGFSLVQTGNVALAMTLASMASPAIFGRLDPGGERRVRWMLAAAALAAALVAAMAFWRGAAADVALAVAYGAISGYGVLQYGYVREAYPPAMRGRALSLFTMAMFLGISLMQWASGLAASAAARWGVEPFGAALATMALMVLAGAFAFWRLPRVVAA